jgi:peptide/nickel transport system permease protein
VSGAARRACQGAVRAAVAVFAIATAAWLCGEAAPGPPAERAARAAGLWQSGALAASPASRAAILRAAGAEHGLDRSAVVRLARFWADLLRLDLGRSWRDGTAVRALVGRALAPTIVLIAGALALALALGLGGALLAVQREGGAADLLLSGLSAVAVALPPVWLAILLLRMFATGMPWSWLPTGGLATVSAGVLPIAALAIVPGFVLGRYARAALIAAVTSPWAVAARARGATRGRVLWRHCLRASGAGLTGVAVNLVAYLLGATLVVERVFGIRGLGALVADSAARGDTPVVVGATVAAGAILAAVSVAGDVVQVWFDPRLASSHGPHD